MLNKKFGKKTKKLSLWLWTWLSEQQRRNLNKTTISTQKATTTTTRRRRKRWYSRLYGQMRVVCMSGQQKQSQSQLEIEMNDDDDERSSRRMSGRPRQGERAVSSGSLAMTMMWRDLSYVTYLPLSRTSQYTYYAYADRGMFMFMQIALTFLSEFRNFIDFSLLPRVCAFFFLFLFFLFC